MTVDESWSEITGGPLANTTSLFSHLERGLRKSPHKPAVLCMHQSSNHLSEFIPVDDDFEQQMNGVPHTYMTLTYTQLHRAAILLAAGMTANGVNPGSTILTLIPNGSEYSVVLWTCPILRLTISSLDPSILDNTDLAELRRLMKILQPRIVVVPNAAGARAVNKTVEDLGLAQPLGIVLGEDSEYHMSYGWKSLLALAVDALSCSLDEEALINNARNDDPQRTHSIFFTSGTSAGEPKGCPQRTSSITHVLHSQSWLMNPQGHNATQLILVQPHNSRAVAPAVTLQAWREGATVVMMNEGSFGIQITLDAIIKHGVDFIILTPAMVHALALVSSGPLKLDSVSAVHLGGDAVTRDVLIKCSELFPTARVFLNHGMAEGGGFFEWPFFNMPITQIPCFGEICPIGKVAPGTRLRIWDADKNSRTRRGKPGELHVCCQSIIQHYLGNASASSFYDDEEGRWFNTGDIGMIDGNGLVFILGRAKDMIKRAGIAIMPSVLESCIEKYTGTQVRNGCLHPILSPEGYGLLISDVFQGLSSSYPSPNARPRAFCGT